MRPTRPIWLDFPQAYVRQAIDSLKLGQLRLVPLKVSPRWSKPQLVNCVYDAFVKTQQELPVDLSELAVKEFFIERLGDTVVRKIIIPPCPPSQPGEPPAGFVFHLPGSSATFKRSTIRDCLNSLHPSRQSPLPDGFARLAELLYESLRERTSMLSKLSMDDIMAFIRCFRPAYTPPPSTTHQELILFFLKQEYEASIVDQIVSLERAPAPLRPLQRSVEDERQWWKEQDASWPHAPDVIRCIGMLKNYHEASLLKYGLVCSVCSRRKLDRDLVVKPLQIFSHGERQLFENLGILSCMDSRFDDDFVFEAPWESLSGLMLDRRGMQVDEQSERLLHVCVKCESYLNKGKMPPHAWANGLYRGKLPARFNDMTWVEEKACAPANTTAHVIRLYNSTREDAPKVFYGNVCAHDANVVDFASALPRTPQDINDRITVIFIGPERYKAECIKKLFYVRKGLMLDFLRYMKYVTKHPDYINVEISEENLAMYPDADGLPGSLTQVIHDAETDTSVFKQETAGPDAHPAEGIRNDADGEPIIFMEKVGVSDADNLMGSAEVSTAYGLRNLYAKKGQSPDLVLQRSTLALPEYHNPRLFPSLFPTLFPYGTGGFEDQNRVTAISFQEQANLYLDTVDRSCRYHHSFIFVVCNIIQRRAGHLGTYLTVGEDRFDAVARRLVGLDEKVVMSVADRLEKGIKLEKLTTQEQTVMELLKEVRTVAAKVPGSFAGKLRARTEIRNYMAFFNLPVFFFTANPNAVHSPLFHMMYGDETINLDERFPSMVAYNERARRVAHDPVAAADFFDVSFRLLLEHLLGWDFRLKQSTKEGGVLGHVSAWFEMSELTGRGGIHGHTIVCMRGSLNPSELHARLREDKVFERRVCEYFDSVQWHGLPDLPERDDVEVDVRCERVPAPPEIPTEIPMGNLTATDCFEHPSAFCARLEVAGFPELGRWWMDFLSDIKTCGEKLQRHTCREVCFKYEHETCRFQFPHEVVPHSHFVEETNSLLLRVTDALVNWFNPWILAAARHNHDIRTMLSGLCSRAVMYYVTDYMTKNDEKTHYIISLFSKAVLAAKLASPENAPAVHTAKVLLQKCLAQLTSRQQIHAQQAVWYIRGNGDAMSSHKTVPMLSASLIRFVRENYSMEHHAIQASSEDEDGLCFDVSESYNSEESQIRLVLDPDNGALECSNQLQNYYYRDPALRDVCFYDFVHRFRVEKKSGVGESAGAYRRFALVNPHRLKHSHEIVEHTNYELQTNPTIKVPVVYGCSIPRSTGNRQTYCMWVLAHFKPFSPERRLIAAGQTWESALDSFSLCDLGQRIVKNWEALYECEDEREQERQRKRDNRMKTTAAMRGAVVEQSELLMVDEMATGEQSQGSLLTDFLTLGTGNILCSGGWIARRVGEYQFGLSNRLSVGERFEQEKKSLWNITHSQLTWWTKALKEQEKAFLRGEGRESKVQAQAPRVYEGRQLTENCPDSGGHALIPTAAAAVVSETPAEVIARVGKTAKLNPEQYRVYEIAANAYVALLEERRLGLEPSVKRLSMLVNGPGGTGKTYAIKTFQDLMTAFRCGHRIKYTAPSGAAASLIQGVTLHSSLKIRVFKGKNKRGQYAITLTSQQKLELQNQFQDIDVLVIDEVSMVSAALMAQIDASTRIAKNNDEPFGGMITIFSGDFCQFPPVAAFALYETVHDINRKNGSSEYKLQSKLGRMAWKTVDTVVELFRQERMKDDPIFGALVLRLRRAQCTEQDVELLNTRVIRSHLNPSGIRLDNDGDLKTATVIVRSNEDRLLANYCKAIDTYPDLIMCTARDYIDDQPVESPLLRSYLLKLDMKKDIGQGALPSYVPLYRGMPVIMRRHNQAACLGIANGAQGFLRDFQVSVDSCGYPYLQSSVVEFPYSQVDLPGLPPKHVPLGPWKYSFQTVLPGNLLEGGQPKLVTVVRHLTDFDPSFAITAHCAQGKTLDKVAGQVNIGGPAAYVTVSRARRLRDLVLLSPVSQATLNQRPKSSLLLETRRLEGLHHNTLVRYGYENGSLVDVEDPDVGDKTVEGSLPIRYTWERSNKKKRKDCSDDPVDEDEQIGSCNRTRGECNDLPVDEDVSSPGSRRSKRKRSNSDRLPVDEDEPITQSRIAKRRRGADVEQTLYTASLHVEKTTAEIPLGNGHPDWPLGCRWDRTNWSCAYDCLVVLIHGIIHAVNKNFLRSLCCVSPEMQSVLQIFQDVDPRSQASLEEVRARCRVLINAWDDTAFPLRGQAVVSMERMLFILTAQVTLGMDIGLRSTCLNCNTHVMLGSGDGRWPIIVSRQLLRVDGPVRLHCIQDWMDLALIDRDVRLVEDEQVAASCNCLSATSLTTVVQNPQPCIYFELQDNGVDVNSPGTLSWSLHNTSGSTTYVLRGIVYLGAFHFTCRLQWDNEWWFYDGQTPNGLPSRDVLAADLNKDSFGRRAHLLLYCAETV